MITYTWKIQTLEYADSLDGLSKVVSKIHWILIGNENQLGWSTFGIQKLDTSVIDPNTFVAFDSLTEAMVISWLESAMGPDTIKSHQDSIAERISQVKQPPLIMASPPWNNQ